jgi:hypothetical protein
MAAEQTTDVHSLNGSAGGVTAALTIGAAATVLALIVTLVAIRVRREDFPDSPLPA